MVWRCFELAALQYAIPHLTSKSYLRGGAFDQGGVSPFLEGTFPQSVKKPKLGVVSGDLSLSELFPSCLFGLRHAPLLNIARNSMAYPPTTFAKAAFSLICHHLLVVTNNDVCPDWVSSGIWTQMPTYRPHRVIFLSMLFLKRVMPESTIDMLKGWNKVGDSVRQKIKRDGITKLVVLPLYPQFSISTSGSSLRLLESIFREDEYLVNMQHTVIPSWYQREGYIKAMADLMEKELKSFERPEEVMIFFSAHGVPLAYVEEAGDPYKAEMEECVDLIMEELEKRRVHNAYTLAYQSRVGPVEWLKPYTDETIIELGKKGVKSILAVPISFVSEHIETLEEIDVEYKELALESGIQNWARVPALGVEPTFISDLADAVIESLPYVGAMAVSNLEARQVLFNSRAVNKKFIKFLFRVDGANDLKYRSLQTFN
ncbi:hypothetical protein HAX54_038525 [Datura stramonium]|uniref:Ferrochelatase n=1 Tax=Datura stramonium TaxID=4076 RepID=A0ABS8VKM7_DATST|nr:hypothetical protein [Datura stramonium]